MSSARTGDKSKDEWMTPIPFFEKLDQEFHFNLDPAATQENTLCDNFFTKEKDGLKQDWLGTVFLNFPYSEAKLWIKKAYEEAVKGNATVVILMPARTDTAYWWSYVRHGEVRFLPGRLKFDHPDGAKYSAPFPSAVVIFRTWEKTQNLVRPKTVYWDWKGEK